MAITKYPRCASCKKLFKPRFRTVSMGVFTQCTHCEEFYTADSSGRMLGLKGMLKYEVREELGVVSKPDDTQV